MAGRQKSLPTIVDCEGCGICCLHMGYPSFVHGLATQADEPHWTSLPVPLKEDLLRYIASYDPPAAGELDGPCYWFDPETRRCKHHQYRPKVCRDFEVGGRECREGRKYYRDKILKT